MNKKSDCVVWLESTDSGYIYNGIICYTKKVIRKIIDSNTYYKIDYPGAGTEWVSVAPVIFAKGDLVNDNFHDKTYTLTEMDEVNGYYKIIKSIDINPNDIESYLDKLEDPK